jgi:anaerobic magnesium-protoporphyrin IX monomethyl ester cyclase
MSSILLINPKDSYTLNSPPLGIAYLISYARTIGKNEVFFHDENFIARYNLDNELDIAIRKYNPNYIGIAFPSSAIKRVLQVAQYIKENHGDITVFAGGYHPTSEPEATLQFIPQIDFFILGQAEYVFGHLGSDWQMADNIAYLNSSCGYVQNPIQNHLKTIDDIPIIDRTIFDSKYYRPNHVISGIFGKTATIMTSRGCPYNCAFCSNKLINKKVRFHSINYVLDEIDSIFSQIGKMDYFWFLDVMFLANWSRIRELCETLIKTKILGETRWAATVAPNVISEDKVRLMKKAGCFYLSFGLESNSPNSLKLMNKVATPKDNERAVEICNRLEILANSAFLFGIPGETESDLQDTINFVTKHNIFSTGINTMKPLPGSTYYDQFISEGIIKQSIEDWHSISSIHHLSEYFNNNLSFDIYNNYRQKFYKVTKRNAKLNYLRANKWKLLKYGWPWFTNKFYHYIETRISKNHQAEKHVM